MKFKEVMARITGISCPVFGVSWKPPEADREVARRVITFLEDRRVLYAHDSQEVAEHCVRSVIEIRHHLTSILQEIPSKSELTENLRAMRAACRKFMETVQEKGTEVVHFAWSHGHWASWKFHAAIGEMRGVFGVHVAQIATKYGLDIEDDLALILPGDASDVDGTPKRRGAKKLELL